MTRNSQPTKRIFVGVPLEVFEQQSLKRQLPKLPGKPVPSENWHLTLQFIGKSTFKQIEDLISNLKKISFPESFSLRLQGWGTFPNSNRAKALWIGVKTGQPSLRALAAEIRASSIQIYSSSLDQKLFTPHLTVSRFRAPTNLSSILKTKSPSLEVLVKRFVLFESLAQPTRYIEIESFEPKKMPSTQPFPNRLES